MSAPAPLTLIFVMTKTLIYAAVGLLLMPSALTGQRPGGQRGGRSRVMDIDRMLTRYDANKDGKLTEAEVDNPRIWQRVITADKDKDGSLSKAELESMNKNRGGRSGRGGRGRGGDTAWKFLADKYDSDKDGRITTDEYQRDKNTFANLDRNKDGVLSLEDWTSSEERAGRERKDRSRGKAPEWGQLAPDFELTFVNNEKETAKLSSYVGNKPVALIFGSCT